MGVRGGRADLASGDAVLEVVGDELNADGVEGGAEGGDLGEDVGAGTVFVEHALEAGDLSGDSAEAFLDALAEFGFHGIRSLYPPGVCVEGWACGGGRKPHNLRFL